MKYLYPLITAIFSILAVAIICDLHGQIKVLQVSESLDRQEIQILGDAVNKLQHDNDYINSVIEQ